MRALTQVRGEYDARFKQAANRATIANDGLYSRAASDFQGKEEWDRGQFREGTPRDQRTRDASAMAMLRRAIGQGTADTKMPKPDELGDDVRLNVGPSWTPGAITGEEYARLMRERLRQRFAGY